MHEFVKTITIDRPSENVWPYLIDTELLQQWVNFESIEQTTQGPVEKGTRWRQTYRFLGKRMDFTDEIVEFDQGKRLVMRPIESPIPYVLEQDLTDVDGGTKVGCRFEVGEFGGFFGKVAEPVVVKLFEREIQAQLERLKLLVEAAG